VADASLPPRDDALLFRRWSDADINLDVRIKALRMWTRNVHAMAARVSLDWCIVSLEDVRDSLSQLRVLVTNARASRRIRRDSLLVQYLAEAYVWTGDVLADVHAFVQGLDGGPLAEGGGSLGDSSAYIDDYLAPLQRQIATCSLKLGVDPALRRGPATDSPSRVGDRGPRLGSSRRPVLGHRSLTWPL
jgi:hypothetical protein